jgi:hypothetical protein
MNKFAKFLSFLALAVFVSSCASVSQYQTAMPTGEGKTNFKITLNGTTREDGEGLPPFIPELGINYGVTDNFDFICKLNSFGSLSFGGKYTLLTESNDKFAIAVGPTMNYFGKIFNATIPLHITIEPNELFSFTITPSYTTPGAYKLKDNANNYYKQINGGYLSLAPYLVVGKKVKFIFGSNISFAKSSIYTDYGFGVNFQF